MSTKTEKFDFKNRQGHLLSGRLETPSGRPRAYALFAHCFTCSKNILAASKISKYLAEQGIAVLRFDFTGLGNSEGDFSNTNFSSNAEDLRDAYEALEDQYESPQILIGHSLGGAAVLKIASEIESIKCIVTIGAPSEVEHIGHLFKNHDQKILKDGSAEVILGGKEFTIKKQFLEDLKGHNILKALENSQKAFLILHSPIDNTVSIDHAAQIYKVLKHPKSFISLDNMDHLVSNPKDSLYIASLISTWVTRYIEGPEVEKRPEVKKGEIKTFNRVNHLYTQDIYGQNHQIIADEPKSLKGDDLGMGPYELLLSSLGACTAMTIRMYADRKNIKLTSVSVNLSHAKEEIEDTNKLTDIIIKNIQLEGDLSSSEVKKLLEIAEKCPVNKSLNAGIITKTFNNA